MADSGTASERHESYKALLAEYQLAVGRLNELAKDPFSPEAEFRAAHEDVAGLTSRLVELRLNMEGDRPNA